MAVAGANLFVANLGTGSITDLNTVTGAVVTVISGTKYMIDRPSSMLSSGADLFVTNNYGNSVTELNVSTGALVRVISGTAYHFDGPQGFGLAGDHLFVANEYGNSVTEVDSSTGALVKFLSGPAYHFNRPLAVAATGSRVFVANYGKNAPGPNGTVARIGASVTELDAGSGQPITESLGRALWVRPTVRSHGGRGPCLCGQLQRRLQ